MRDHAEAAKITAASLGAELRKVNEKNVQLDREAAECHNEWERLRRWSEELKAEQVKHCARVNKRHPQTGNNVIHLNGGEGDAA
jgi:FtsZ-binding cell division protein ZapB